MGKPHDTKLPLYNPQEIAKKWQDKWAVTHLYKVDIKHAAKPYYVLMMFPYPSAEGLHIGSIYSYTGADTYARYKRMNGFDVFHPMGLDSFGIHSENYALKIGKHPMDQAKIAEENFYRQLHATGNSYDWSRKLETSSPDYYKWTQWLFIELFKAGLAYRKKAPVNYCPSCKTVLSDEQVIDGKCERCGNIVEKRDLEQWFFRITHYAESLLKNIPALNWAEKVKTAQHNWIGKKEGALLDFPVQGLDCSISVFTTRPDTLFGVTALILAPQHPLFAEKQFMEQVIDRNAVEKYINEHQNKSLSPQEEAAKEKTGINTGVVALHPVTGKAVPVWVSDYVLMGYGTGAIMAVPAHDERDFEFAQKLGIDIKQVISKNGVPESLTKAYVGEGMLINSGSWNGLSMPQEMEKVLSELEEKGIGKRQVNYHLRDWLISRQRYWGPPIPMIFCEKCFSQGKSWFTQEEKHSDSTALGTESAGWYPASDLPVELPYIKDYRPLGTGASPLGNHPEFYETVCPGCGGLARRETDVSDTFLDSAWYFFRYTATEVTEKAFETDRIEKWMPVPIYIGGAEHSVLHLLYARFITHVLKDLGYLQFTEPFSRFYANGLIIKDGAKMSKSKGNVILPDPMIDKFGIDTVRMYLRFIGPFSEGGDFRDTGIEGMHRFMKRIWTLFTGTTLVSIDTSTPAKHMRHKTIKAVSEEMEALRFNTAIAKLMEYYNFLSKEKAVSHEDVRVFLKLIAPIAPHIAEEIWERLGESYSIHTSPWPIWEEAYLAEEQITIVVQVNGKVRDTLIFPSQDPSIQDKSIIEAKARESKRISEFLAGKKIGKSIYVPGKILNLVVAS